MRRFEFSEGKSNKFWEIEVSGSSFTTTHGKIGTDGRSTTKDFDSASEARKAADKLVAQKTKKGYVLVGGGGGGGGSTSSVADARNPELEAAIAANPEDTEAYAVLADWLQEQGHPRGELISLHLAGKTKQAKALFDKHADVFLGPLAEHQVVRDSGANNSSSALRTPAQESAWQETQQKAFLWRNGFIHRVRLSHDIYSDEDWDGQTAEVLTEVLAHPSARFVVEFAFQSNGDPNEDDLQSLIDVLAKHAPASTRKITFGDNIDQISWHHTGKLGKLWPGVPNLRVLEIESGDFEVGKMVAPALERAVFITGGLSKTCGRDLAKAQIPNIRHLEIYYGNHDYGADCTISEVRPLLARTDLPHLEYLGLENAEFANDIARALAGAPVLAGLKTLDLSQGTLTDEGADALVAAKASLSHLECLDLSENFLTQRGIQAVAGLCKQVVTSAQREPWDWGDGELRYYVSVGE